MSKLMVNLSHQIVSIWVTGISKTKLYIVAYALLIKNNVNTKQYWLFFSPKNFTSGD